MNSQMIQINVPVPPAPILEEAVGYRNEHDARYLALWWEPCGDEVMVSDGYVTFTGHWPGYLAYIQHKVVFPQVIGFQLGSSEKPAHQRLVIDLRDRQAMVMPAKEADQLLASQWRQEGNPVAPITISLEELEKWLEGFAEQHPMPNMEELVRLMEEDRQHVVALQRWLDEQSQ
jgi:hypothetical protein